MPRLRTSWKHIALAMVLSVALAGCRSETTGSDSLLVAVTITPLASISADLTSGRARVAALLPPGASPHTFEPLPRDRASVNATRLLVRIGAGLDDWSERLLTGLPSRPLTVTFMELTAADPLPWSTAEIDNDDLGHAHADAGVDPHIWLDPIRVRDALVPALLDALIAVDPAGEASYRQRASDIATRLTDLDSTIRDTLANVPSRAFVAYHDTWRYFAARYDLEMVGAIETYAGDEPSAAELASLIAAARARNVRAVILEPQLGERVARVIATEIGAALVMADPLGDPAVPERADYFANMKFNAGAFARALSGPVQ